jgi:hypothetical protein
MKHAVAKKKQRQNKCKKEGQKGRGKHKREKRQ